MSPGYLYLVHTVSSCTKQDQAEVMRMVRTWPGCPVVEIRPVETNPLQ